MSLIKKADANPTRAFFVRMLTRDISLEDCILDLIDNSVDGAIRLTGGEAVSLDTAPDLSSFSIDILANRDQFIISDNCGGITLDDAAEYAFTFGRKDSAESERFSIGVYGIGMKRAMFKMGSKILVRSTYDEVTQRSSFQVPIDVSAWVSGASKDWDFDLESADHLDEPGVRLEITELTEDVASAFESSAFLQNLRRVISRDYALHLLNGLRIAVNGQAVAGWNLQLLQGGEFSPMRQKYVESIGDRSVSVEIVAGMAAPPPDSNEPEASRRDDRNGWYIVCNGRVVVAADKSSLSGWGTEGWPSWHPQYAGFIGVIFFTSEHAELLPVTTTKRSIDATSGLFKRARPQMRDVTRAWTAYTNERKSATEQDKKAAEGAASPVALRAISQGQPVRLPKFQPRPSVPMANITYAMPLERVRSLADALGNINMAYREVGVRSFDLAFKDYVGGE